MLQQLRDNYDQVDWQDLSSKQMKHLRAGLETVATDEIRSASDGKAYIELLRKFREAIAENDKLHGANYPKLLNSLLSVGEDGLYSNNLRFIFELIQNVDDCSFISLEDCRLDMHFDFNSNEIKLTYNETGFTPFNVFAITGIAEAAKNVSAFKDEIGEKGIGFKSVFGVAKKVWIKSGWFSFELHKENFTIPIPVYDSADYYPGTQMTLYVPGHARVIYREIKSQYCRKDALFSRNPLLFLNKLTSLRMYYDSWRSMEFRVSRSALSDTSRIAIERNVELSVNLHDYENGSEINEKTQIVCSRYTYPVVFSKDACRSRYGEKTQVGGNHGKQMALRLVVPNREHLAEIGMGALYSFLPTQLKLTIPIVCHVPFKLDASREFVDPQGENLWFHEASKHLSELMDFMYQDWKALVREDIVQYLPALDDSIFARNNGKEKCLSKQEVFKGKHFLRLPLFWAIDGSYHTANEVFCFDPSEQIVEPKKIFDLMHFPKALFIPTVSVSKLGLHTERNIKSKLFRLALSTPNMTSDALDYLDSVDYEYKEIPEEAIVLNVGQIETIFRHKKLADLLQEFSCSFVQKNMRIQFSIEGGTEVRLTDILYKGFELSETPRKVENYITYCSEACVCLNIGEDCYLPCHNALVLSRSNVQSSFAAFCYKIDEKDTFAIRIKLREASNRLNQFVEEETGSPLDYLRNLRNTRLIIKESLGSAGYKSYIDLILKSGTDRNRYIQEVLQNADDCSYAPNATPTFTLSQKGNVVFTEYNETGFTRANIRAITAIGESTKNRLFDGNYSAIGEKGVGFKTIFSVAKEVKIQSGEYAFALTDREPTIPKIIKQDEQGSLQGTRMEITLKNPSAFPSFDDRAGKAILELCLCLRKLKSVKIGQHSVTISDTDDRRTIAIDKRQFVFKRFTHSFTVTDETALNERRNGSRVISAEQSIVCFVPEKGGQSEYALYNGLPTRHRIKIPIVIDAPFALTTSREEIESESSAWNNIVREEMYKALLHVIDCLKQEERSKIFRFTKFLHQIKGNVHVYVNDISDCNYLTSFDYTRLLSSSSILPSYDETVFIAPKDKTSFRFPAAANYLFRNVSKSEYAGIQPSAVIDVEGSDYDSTLNALSCATASFEQAFPIIEKHAEHFIREDEFRSKLYDFLKEAPPIHRVKWKNLAIIPVYATLPSAVEYVRWADDSIFVKKGATQSRPDYYVLNEKLLEKSDCEKIFGVNINEMNAEFEKARYNERLKKYVQTEEDSEKIYARLITAYTNGDLQRNDSFGPLLTIAEYIPLKNELGNITFDSVFLCDQPAGYFPTELIQRLIIHKECADFAKALHRYRDLSDIGFGDFNYFQELTADDVETLSDDYFKHSEEILLGFYRSGFLSDELVKEYELEYLTVGHMAKYTESYVFPEEIVKNSSSLREHVRKQWQNPTKVVSVKVERTESRGQKKDGSTFDLNREDAREGALRTYTPEGAHGVCFCQMCLQAKSHQFIEVNNIELNPAYYFPQLRISLCLECSKKFKLLRNKDSIRDAFTEAIKRTPISPEQGHVDIRIGSEDSITFTAKHLAEVQEIFLQRPNGA